MPAFIGPDTGYFNPNETSYLTRLTQLHTDVNAFKGEVEETVKEIAEMEGKQTSSEQSSSTLSSQQSTYTIPSEQSTSTSPSQQSSYTISSEQSSHTVASEHCTDTAAGSDIACLIGDIGSLIGDIIDMFI